MKIAVTGHRPHKLGNEYDGLGPISLALSEYIRVYYQLFNPDEVYVGMALGTDWIAARQAIAMEIPVIAAVPFEGQELRWSPKLQAEYRKLLSLCAEVHIISEGGYSAEKMYKRNEWMVDKLTEPEDRLIAVWDGRPEGGTYQCTQYAARLAKEMILIHPQLLKPQQ